MLDLLSFEDSTYYINFVKSDIAVAQACQYKGVVSSSAFGFGNVPFQCIIDILCVLTWHKFY